MANLKTQAQEKSSLLIFQRVLRDNVAYNSWEDIKKDVVVYEKIKNEFKKVNELNQYNEVPVDWMESYYKQQAKILKIYKSSQWDEFRYNGSGSFMEFLKEKLKQYKKEVKKYEQWNPADVWIVKTPQSKIEKIIEEEIKGAGQTLEEFNEVLRNLFKQKKIVGISLKKVSGKVALYEVVNINPKFFDTDKTKNYDFEIDKIRLNLSVDLEGKKTGLFGTQDLTVSLSNQTKSNVKKITFQIKQNVTSSSRLRYDNLKFETYGSSSAARSGKAEIKKVLELLKSKGINFINNYRKYPMNLEQFEQDSRKYVTIFNSLKNKSVDIGSGLTNSLDFIGDMRFAFENYPDSANSKLMQMDLINKILSLPEKDQREIWTDMYFLSIKKGKSFGPHGKLY